MGNKIELLSESQIIAQEMVSDYLYRKEFGLSEREMLEESYLGRMVNSYIMGAYAERRILENKLNG